MIPIMRTIPFRTGQQREKKKEEDEEEEEEEAGACACMQAEWTEIPRDNGRLVCMRIKAIAAVLPQFSRCISRVFLSRRSAAKQAGRQSGK